MEASRRRMQEELDAKAVVFREKQKEVKTVRKGGGFRQARSDLSSFEFLSRKKRRREDRNWTECSMGRASEQQRDNQK